MPNPPLTPQTTLDACIQTFLRVSTLYRVGGGWGRRDNCKKISKRKHYFVRDPKKLQKNINTALLSQELLSMIVWLCALKELLQENEENCGKHILVVSYPPPPPPPLSRFPCTLDPIDTDLGCLKYNQTKASFSFQDWSKENHYYWADHFFHRLCSRCSISERSVKYR